MKSDILMNGKKKDLFLLSKERSFDKSFFKEGKLNEHNKVYEKVYRGNSKL